MRKIEKISTTAPAFEESETPEESETVVEESGEIERIEKELDNLSGQVSDLWPLELKREEIGHNLLASIRIWREKPKVGAEIQDRVGAVLESESVFEAALGSGEDYLLDKALRQLNNLAEKRESLTEYYARNKGKTEGLYTSRLHEFAGSVILKSLPQLEKVISEQMADAAYQTFKAVENLIGLGEERFKENGDPSWRDAAVAFLERNAQAIVFNMEETAANESRDSETQGWGKGLLLTLRYCSSGLSKEITDLVVKLYSENPSEGALRNLLEVWTKDVDMRGKNKGKEGNESKSESADTINKMTVEILSRILKSYGLGFDITKAWPTNKVEDLPSVYLINLEAIKELEKARPGAAKLLHEEFGISVFARYPIEMLVKQVEESESDKPYGVVINPLSDWNGTFYGDRLWLDVFSAKLRMLGSDYTIRITEAGSKMDIARRLIGLDRKYGAKNKISFAIVGAHGAANRMNFGGKGKNLFIEDLLGKGVQRAKRFFVENSTIILSSCKTGKRKGIGPTISEKLGVKVIAPNFVGGVGSIKVSLDNVGRLKFEAVYSGGKQMKVFEEKKAA